MLFPIFAVLSVIVLRLTTSARFKTIVWIAIAVGLIADFGTDLLVTLRR